MSDSFTEHTRGNNSRFLKYQTFCKCGFYKISETYTRSCTCMQKRENLQISAQTCYSVATKNMSDLSQYRELKGEGYPLANPPLTLTIRGLPSRLAKTDGFESTFNANWDDELNNPSSEKMECTGSSCSVSVRSTSPTPLIPWQYLDHVTRGVKSLSSLTVTRHHSQWERP